MEIRVRERLVGALVLVALVVLLVPALLKGPRQSQDAAPGPQLKSVEVTLTDGVRTGAEDALVPEPAPPPARATAAPSAQAEPPARERAPEPAAAVPAAPAPRPAAPAATAAAAAEQPAWAVQLGAFSTREKAEGLVADLRRRGYAAFVLEYRAGGQVLHRVRVGPEQDRARAAAIAERLRKDGFQPVVAPHP
ncbi:MAG: SPOR domain-containing protein [Steroidobacteraceae bacterium]|nr:SPOR domain-containing protein [Steroidobacteraceae bacterium]